MELTLDVFMGKILFRDDDGETPEDSPNSFISVSAACEVRLLRATLFLLQAVFGK